MSSTYQPAAKVSEIKPGERKIVTLKDKEIGIFNVDGTFHAYLNRCPHMGAPLCKGRICKQVESNRPGTFTYTNEFVLRCPWHGWEFDIDTGTSIFDDSIRAKKYQTRVQNGMIYCKV